jgi:hypothetical protein
MTKCPHIITPRCPLLNFLLCSKTHLNRGWLYIWWATSGLEERWLRTNFATAATVGTLAMTHRGALQGHSEGRYAPLGREYSAAPRGTKTQSRMMVYAKSALGRVLLREASAGLS